MSKVQDEYQARLARWSDIQDQMRILHDWALRSRKIIELGVRTGNSTAAFLAGLEIPGGELWSIDVNEPQVPNFWREMPAWHLLVCDDLDPAALGFCPDQADVLFIDTSHYYEPTLAELRLYSGKVRPGGVILVHDTCNTDDWPDVPRVMDDWCAENGLSWTAASDKWPGLGMVTLPGA